MVQCERTECKKEATRMITIQEESAGYVCDEHARELGFVIDEINA